MTGMTSVVFRVSGYADAALNITHTNHDIRWNLPSGGKILLLIHHYINLIIKIHRRDAASHPG
jgi:hypothetical protein